MSLLFRYAAGVAAILALSACDPRFVHKSNLSPQEVESLSGTWSGRAFLSFSNSGCPRAYLWSMHVAGGNVDGTIVDAQTPNAPPGTFSTFVDYDGSINASVRTKGHDFALLGSFNRDGFSGTARSDAGCNYTVTLPHSGGAS